MTDEGGASRISLDRHGAARLAMTSLRGGEADAAIQETPG
jgi:hypothetical protein